MKLKQIPNILSTIRILLVFVFLYVFFGLNDHLFALIVFLVAGATDIVDGFLARRNNWITPLGKILDPFADKLMQCTVLVSLYIKDMIPLWFVIPYFLKEIFTLLMGFVVIKRRSVTVVSKWYGKLAVCVFYLTIAVSLIFEDFLSTKSAWSVAIFAPAVICAFVALISYLKHYSYLRKETPKKGNLLKIRKES